jgi:hypothetical protein
VGGWVGWGRRAGGWVWGGGGGGVGDGRGGERGNGDWRRGRRRVPEARALFEHAHVRLDDDGSLGLAVGQVHLPLDMHPPSRLDGDDPLLLPNLNTNPPHPPIAAYDVLARVERNAGVCVFLLQQY